MEWVRENWFFIIFAILFIGIHLFGFGCHGKHGGHGGHGADEGGGEHKGHAGEESSEKKGGGSCH